MRFDISWSQGLPRVSDLLDFRTLHDRTQTVEALMLRVKNRIQYSCYLIQIMDVLINFIKIYKQEEQFEMD